MEGKKYLCKYKVATLALMNKGENIIADPTNIMSVEYLTDYEFNLRSVLKIVLRLDIRKKLWILKNKKDIVCKFELNRIGMDVDTEEFITGEEPIWDQEFSVFLSEEDEATDVKALEERIARNEGDDFQMDELKRENYYETQNLVPLYLFNQKLLDASNKIYNNVFTENTVQQFVGQIVSETKHTEVLMSPCENDEVYKELLIPPLPAYKALIYLDQYYGMYKKGAVIYYDINTLYILNSAGGEVTAKREDEWAETAFLVSGVNQTHPGNGMLRKDGEKTNFILLSDMDISPEKFTDVNNEYIGSNAKVVTTDDVEIETIEADQTYINQRNESITFNRKADNKFRTEILKARMEENEAILYISASNVDISSFTPNKLYHVAFEEELKQKRFGQHKYRIAYASHVLALESEEYMTATTKICLKKCAVK